MELFKEINYIQNFARISINRDTFKNNSSWLDYVEEIELRDFLNKDVNIYTHDYLDFSGSFQESIIEDYISKKKENQFMTIENYIQRFIWWNISVLENILFSKNSHEEYNDRTTEQLELINFPKHFVSISDELIYTIEKRGAKEYHYIFLKGFENKDENFQKDYFLNLYKFLSKELPILLKEIDENETNQHKIIDNSEAIIDCNLRDFLQEEKISDNDYRILVNAMLQFVKEGTLPHIQETIVIKTSMKKIGWAIYSILKECGLKLNYGILKFAQNNISLFENNKEVFDETNFRNTYIYKLFTENPYKKKNN